MLGPESGTNRHKVTAYRPVTARGRDCSLFCYSDGWLPCSKGGAKGKFSVEKAQRLRPRTLWPLPKQQLLKNLEISGVTALFFYFVCKALAFFECCLTLSRQPKLNRKNPLRAPNSLPSFIATRAFSRKNFKPRQADRESGNPASQVSGFGRVYFDIGALSRI